MPEANRSERIWIGGTVVIGLLLAVVGWFFLIAPQRDQTAQVQGETADAQLQNVTLQTRITKLNAESKNWTNYVNALTEAQRALPQQSNMSIFLRDVQSIATATSTRVTALNVGDPAAATPAAPAPTPAASSASSTPATGSGVTAPANSLLGIPIDASVTGGTSALNNFLTRLQTVQPRAVLIASVTRNANNGANAGTGAGAAVLQIKMTAFVAPAAAPANSVAPTGGN